jgi:hypothetical protein
MVPFRCFPAGWKVPTINSSLYQMREEDWQVEYLVDFALTGHIATLLTLPGASQCTLKCNRSCENGFATTLSRLNPPRECSMNQSSRQDKSGMSPSALRSNTCARHETAFHIYPFGTEIIEPRDSAEAVIAIPKAATMATNTSICHRCQVVPGPWCRDLLKLVWSSVIVVMSHAKR